MCWRGPYRDLDSGPAWCNAGCVKETSEALCDRTTWQLTHTNRQKRQKRRATLRIFCWCLLQLETYLAPHGSGLRERADERQRNPVLLILLIQPLPLKKSQPSSLLTLAPSQTGKPLLNNVIVYFILTVTSTSGKNSLIGSLKRAVSPLTADCAPVWVADFDCSLLYT